jgi:hypothetical protein
MGLFFGILRRGCKEKRKKKGKRKWEDGTKKR